MKLPVLGATGRRLFKTFGTVVHARNDRSEPDSARRAGVDRP